MNKVPDAEYTAMLLSRVEHLEAALQTQQKVLQQLRMQAIDLNTILGKEQEIVAELKKVVLGK